MSTTGYILANRIGLYIDGDLVGYGENCSISGSDGLIEMGNKEVDYKAVITNEKQLTIAFAGVFRFDAGYGLEDIITAWMNGTKITARIAHDDGSNLYLQISGYISEFEQGADFGDKAVMSFNVISTSKMYKAASDKQYIYYDGLMLYYSGAGAKEVYYDGTTYVRKYISSGQYKKQISTDGSSWSDMDPLQTITGTKIRNGISGGKWYVDEWDGSAWNHLEGPTSATGGTGYYRDGVRDSAYVLDEALTPLAFAGVEGTDWVNLQKISIP